MRSLTHQNIGLGDKMDDDLLFLIGIVIVALLIVALSIGLNMLKG